MEFIKELMVKLDFEPEAQAFFLEMYNRLFPLHETELCKLKFDFAAPDVGDTDIIQNKLQVIADEYGYHIFSMDMLFLLYSAEDLYHKYENSSYDIKLYYDIMMDLKYKLKECKTVYGIWGSATFWWFRRHMAMTLFALGRFQFEKNVFMADTYTFGDITINRGDEVFTFHIPSSGSMPKEARFDSYRQAFKFFGCEEKGYMPIVCQSWLVYPENKFIFPENSNLYELYNEFDILYTIHSEKIFANAVRIFNMEFNGDTSILPRETTLQKKIIEWLDKGNKIEEGYGIMLFDGEKIINR